MKKAILIIAVAGLLLGCDTIVARTKASIQMPDEAQESVEKVTFTCRWPNGSPIEIPGTNGDMLTGFSPKSWSTGPSDTYYKLRAGSVVIRVPVQYCVSTDSE